MKYFATIFILTTILSCTDRNREQAVTKQKLVLPDLAVINATFPLTLADLDWHGNKNIIHLNEAIKAQLSKTIYSYYFNDCRGDSGEMYYKVKDTYLGTLRLYDSLQTLFLVVLRHFPDELVNSKVLFYDNSSKEFIGEPIDFNLHALYDYDSGKLKPSKLRSQFKITSPEIELVDPIKDGVRDFKFTRLYHDGTANAIETTVLRAMLNEVDTVNFKQKWIGLGTEN